jgi:hypothetical protein
MLQWQRPQQPDSGLEASANSERRFSSLYVTTNVPHLEQVTGSSSSNTFG